MTLRSRYFNGMRCFRCCSCRRIRGTALKHLHLVKFSPQNCWPFAMQLNFSLVFMVFHLPGKEVGRDSSSEVRLMKTNLKKKQKCLFVFRRVCRQTGIIFS